MFKILFFKHKSTYSNGRFIFVKKKIVKYLSDDVLCYSHIK